ncbi:hypothetical protein BDDG_12036 [Blastomyces dermatitidis ATCC 18188]|uniref:Uncharacterized protein n=1 Tax=Ajellomyces dermatitidis (strain ATCC 18188 / CBS 674.68) TaxID=653446 RepID=A0A0J9EQ06_AJEDA|nr:hypothetical protein BDDG_12036 [Blastomyces dermatitidis ATCC 18188]
MKKSQNSADSTQQYSEQSLSMLESYATVLTERESDVATAAERAENRLNTDELTDRRDNISLQGTATIITGSKEAEEEEDMTMRVILSQLIDVTVFTFNLTFLTVTEAAAASQRCLLTRKHQNKFSIIL